jgi:hypothetical protein
MPKRDPKPGDYYLKPYAGKRINLLVQAVEFHPSTGHWYVRNAKDGEHGPVSLLLLSSCHRCSPSQAARILAAAGVPASDLTHNPALREELAKQAHAAAGDGARWADLEPSQRDRWRIRATAGVNGTPASQPSQDEIDAAILNCFALHGLVKNPDALLKAGRALLGTAGVKGLDA